MVVDQPHRLHEGVDRRRADERPAATLELLAQGRRGRGFRQLHQGTLGHLARPLARGRQMRPEEGSEGAELLLHLDCAPRIVDRRLDLAPVPHDARVLEQPLYAPSIEPRDPVVVESGERLPEVLSLSQNGQPAQPRLKSFETDLLEEAPIVVDRPSPFVIVIRCVVRTAYAPPAAREPVLAENEPLCQTRHWRRRRLGPLPGAPRAGFRRAPPGSHRARSRRARGQRHGTEHGVCIGSGRIRSS